MTTKKIYGPWLEWHGGECPVPPETMVKVRFRDRFAAEPRRAGLYEWGNTGLFGDIVEYCVAIDAAKGESNAAGTTIRRFS